MDSRLLITWLHILYLLVDPSRSFLFDYPTCTPDDPCYCSSTEIDCQSLSLPQIPQFNSINITQDNFTLDFSDNVISYLSANAFANLLPFKKARLEINLHGNRLLSIDSGAFDGIADNIEWLFLDSNELRTVPKALEKLTNLRQLDLVDNPISSFNTSSTTFSVLGKHLKLLDVGLSHFIEWPVEFNNLRVLTELYVENMRLTDLPINAFSPFENSLTWLHIQMSDLQIVPEAVCNLPNLKWFYFTDNAQLSGDILGNCTPVMPSVMYVEFMWNHLTALPNVLHTFPNVQYLNMSHNLLTDITDGQIPDGTVLDELDLDYNLLQSIPAALGKLTLLKYLYINDNQLKSISDVDFSNLRSLYELTVAYNPITTVSNNAFKNLVKLERLDLQGTRLQILPTSLSHLDNLLILDLDGNPTECSCGLSALETWSRSLNYLTIYGYCYQSSREVSTYLRNDLSSCP